MRLGGKQTERLMTHFSLQPVLRAFLRKEEEASQKHAATCCQHTHGPFRLWVFFPRTGLAGRCRSACWEGGGLFSSVCGGPTSVSVCAALGKMAEAEAGPPHRFFCHGCKGEVNPQIPVRQTRLLLNLAQYVVQVVRLSSETVGRIPCVCLC